jgi:hypothetical protein
MASEKITYWAAVGILALLVGNHFMGKIDGLCLRGRMFSVMERISDSALRTGDRAQMVFDRGSSRYDRVQSRVAFAQSRIASAQSLLARKEASLARAQAFREQRIMMMDQVRNSVFCPRQKIEVVIPEIPPPVNDDSI